MKLFITNKKDFDQNFDKNQCHCNGNCGSGCLTSNQIHVLIYNQLSENINLQNSIPILIMQSITNGESVAMFNFVTKKENVYFYEFIGTAS